MPRLSLSLDIAVSIQSHLYSAWVVISGLWVDYGSWRDNATWNDGV
jgi:hypothetical protein